MPPSEFTGGPLPTLTPPLTTLPHCFLQPRRPAAQGVGRGRGCPTLLPRAGQAWQLGSPTRTCPPCLSDRLVSGARPVDGGHTAHHTDGSLPRGSMVPPTGLRGERGLPGAPAQREAVSQARSQHPHPQALLGAPALPLGPALWGPHQPSRAVQCEAPRLLLILRKIANTARSFRCANPHAASVPVW